MGSLTDALGVTHAPAAGPARIVCLVPSITELVCDLGLTDQLVGRTGFCIHPKDALRRVPKVGGTKDVDLSRVQALAPTHVILNLDENRRETADALARFVPNLIVTHPCAPEDNPALYRLIGGIFNRGSEADALCHRFEEVLETTRQALAGKPRLRVLYLIWKDPWMSISRDTYIARTLQLAGLDAIDLEQDRRYPEIRLDQAQLARVDVVMLSTEPYRFRERHAAALRVLPEMAGRKVVLVDGEITSWYGSRAIAGIASLVAVRNAIETAPACR